MVFTVRNSPVGATAIAVACLSSVGGFLFGYDTGQISGVLIMNDFRNRFGTERDAMGGASFNVWIEGVLVSLLSIGTLMGALLGPYLADGLGRRRAMQWEVFVFCIGVVIQVTAFQAWYQIAIGRWVTGLGVGALSAAVPVYQSETVPRQIRGTLVGTYQWAITFGILVANAINIGTREADNSASWRVPIALGIPFSMVLAIGITFCPESPRWLAAHGKHEEARRSVARVRGQKVEAKNAFVEAEYYEILQAVREEENMPTAGWADCFRTENRTLYRTLLGCALQTSQQFTGANLLFYYAGSIFEAAGVQDPFLTSLILSAVNFCCTVLGLYLLDVVGRRKLLLWGGILCSVWFFVFSGAGVGAYRPGTLTDPQYSYGIGILLIVSACLFICAYACTWAVAVWLWVGESFASRTRAKQAALATAANWAANWTLSFFVPPITGDIGLAIGFIFAVWNLLSAALAYFFVYENKDLSLEAINQMYADPDCKPWTSAKWCPPGVTSRNELAKEAQDEEKAAGVPDANPPSDDWNAPTPTDRRSDDEAHGINAKFARKNGLKTEDA